MKYSVANGDTDVQFGPKPKVVYINLPFKGQQSNLLKRQLTRLFAKLAPWIKLNYIFYASNKIAKLSKFKSVLPVVKCSHVIYQISCTECDEFYIGLTNRRLKARINEHRTNDNSALFRHSFFYRSCNKLF